MKDEDLIQQVEQKLEGRSLKPGDRVKYIGSYRSRRGHKGTVKVLYESGNVDVLFQYALPGATNTFVRCLSSSLLLISE